MQLALALEPWQVGALVAGWIAFFFLPAIWMWRRAARDGDAPLTWAALVLVGSILGIVEYYHHRSILRRRAARAARAAEADAAAREGVPGAAPPRREP